MIYSYLGFLLEKGFAAATGGRKERKCRFLLPLCPVYGLGAVALVALPASMQGNPGMLILCAALVTSATEYAVGTFYWRCLGVRFWDYGDLPLNVQGRVCLYFSMAWGALSLVLLRLVHPFVAAAAALLPVWAAWPLAALFACDTLFTYYLLARFRDIRRLTWRWEAAQVSTD